MTERGLFDVTGRVVCVTGASSGLGRSAASLFARSGAQVVGVARRETLLQDWQSNAPGETAFVTADLTDREALTATADAVCSAFGPPDILINAAGINTRQGAEEVTADLWDKTMNLNLAAPFFLAQSLIKGMKSKGWGRIINFASLQSRRAFKNGISYGASKGGVEQMTRAMAESWSSFGITANAIAPGFVHTELTAKLFEEADVAAELAAQTCIGRNGVLEDLHGPLLFLCSPGSDYVTGQVLFVDGGFTAK